MLAEYARQALGRTIIAPFLDHEGTLRVIALDPPLEQAMAEALVQTADGEFLAMDPNLAAMVVDSAAEQVEQAIGRRRPSGAAVLGPRAPPPAACCASSGCRSWRSARTTRSLRVSEWRPLV